MKHQKKKLLTILSRQQIVILGFIGVITITFLACLIAFRLGYGIPRASEQQQKIISNTATIRYCTEGDAASACDPANNLYSGSTTSNAAETVVTQTIPATAFQNICGRIRLSNRKTGNRHTAVAITLRTAQGQKLHEVTVSATDDGVLSLTLPENLDISEGTNYQLRLKPKGYLGKTITINSATDTCQNPSTTDHLVGDFDDDNEITLKDLVAAIRAYNGQTNSTITGAYEGKAPTLSDLIGLIRVYNLSPKGED